jgi:hypothetical protein
MKAYVEAGLAKDAVKKCNSRYQINIMDNSNKTKVLQFSINLMPEDQKVEIGVSKNADATFEMTDNDFNLMCQGKLNP